MCRWGKEKDNLHKQRNEVLVFMLIFTYHNNRHLFDERCY